MKRQMTLMGTFVKSKSKNTSFTKTLKKAINLSLKCTIFFLKENGFIVATKKQKKPDEIVRFLSNIICEAMKRHLLLTVLTHCGN